MLKSEQKRREIKKMVKKLSEKLAKKMALDFQINKSRFTMVEEPKKK
jgi:ribosomal protein S17E